MHFEIPEILEESVQARAAMRATAHHPYRRRAGRGHADSCRLCAVHPLCSTDAPAAVIRGTPHRHVNYAEDRLVVLDERDVDRELAIAIDELLGAVEGIDEPVRIPAAALLETRESRFLRQDGQIGGQLLQSRDNEVMRRHVRPGDRRFIVLCLYIEIGRVNFEDRLAGLGGQGNKRINELWQIHSTIINQLRRWPTAIP